MAQVQRAHVYVASEFGGWQAHVLRWLAQHYDEASKSFAKEAVSGVIDEVRGLFTARLRVFVAQARWHMLPFVKDLHAALKADLHEDSMLSKHLPHMAGEG